MESLLPIFYITALAMIFGLLLGYAAIRFKVEGDPLVDQIDALLPQTQCGQCSYAGCRPYAEAIAAGKADINQCPPGGEATLPTPEDGPGVQATPGGRVGERWRSRGTVLGTVLRRITRF